MEKSHKLLEKIFAILKVWEALRFDFSFNTVFKDYGEMAPIIAKSAQSFLDQLSVSDTFRFAVFENFADFYTEEELGVILEFCDSDAGRKFLANSLLEDTMSLVQDFVTSPVGSEELKDFIKNNFEIQGDLYEDLSDEESNDEDEEQSTFSFWESSKDGANHKKEGQKLKDIFNEPDTNLEKDEPF